MIIPLLEIIFVHNNHEVRIQPNCKHAVQKLKEAENCHQLKRDHDNCYEFVIWAKLRAVPGQHEAPRKVI